MHGREVREAALGLVRSGLSASEAARRVGASRSCARYWCGAAGVRLAPGRTGGPEVRLAEPAQAAELPARRSPRARPGPERRAPVADRRRAGRGVREIARELGVSHSTASRELRRNARPDGRRDAGFAQRAATSRASRPRAGKPGRDPRLRAEVVRRLSALRSPEQVSASLRGPTSPGGRRRA